MLKQAPNNLTLDTLRNSVGTEKANEFVRSIGVAVLHAAQGHMPGSLESIVTSVIGRLSQEDLSSLARGDMGVMNRVQAMAEGQVKAMQASQPAVNQLASLATSAAGGQGQWVNGTWVGSKNGLSERGGNQFAELRGRSGATGDTSTGEGSGYSWLSAANQNIAGFSQAQIASAANFLKGAGLTQAEVNEDTKHMVHLSKYRKEIGDFIKRKKDIEKRRARGEDVSEEERRLEEDKKKAREKMTPEERKHFDQIHSIQTSTSKLVAELGNDKAAKSSDEMLKANVKKTGLSSKYLETKATSVATEQKKTTEAVENDLLAAAGLDKPTDVTPPKAAEEIGTKPKELETAAATEEKPKSKQMIAAARQPVRSSAQQPS